MKIKPEIKVIISDLDGTLLNNEHKISEYTKSIFQELHNQQYTIIIATGRHHLDALPIVATLGFPVYLVTSNGARIHSPQKELLFAVNLKEEPVKSILALKIDPEITTVLFKENVWQTNKFDERLNRFQSELNYHPELVDFSTIEDFNAIKIFFTHEKQSKLVELREQILATHAHLFNHSFSLPLCLEFMDKSVDKSVAIRKILELENLDFNNAISFGDGFNDENMLKATAKGLVMANAPDSLKNAVPHLEIIGNNNEDGVANYLAKHYLDIENI